MTGSTPVAVILMLNQKLALGKDRVATREDGYSLCAVNLIGGNRSCGQRTTGGRHTPAKLNSPGGRRAPVGTPFI